MEMSWECVVICSWYFMVVFGRFWYAVEYVIVISYRFL